MERATLLDQMHDEEFRKLVRISLKYWKPRVASYEDWLDYENALVMRKNEISVSENRYIRIIARKEIVDQVNNLKSDLREYVQTALDSHYARFLQSDRPLRDRSASVFRKRYDDKLAQISELDAASATPETWNMFLTERNGCAVVILLVCALVVVSIIAYVCRKELKVIYDHTTGQNIEVEEEVCEEKPVETEEEKCHEETQEQCEDDDSN